MAEVTNATVEDIPAIVDLWKELFQYHKKLPGHKAVEIHQKTVSGADKLFAKWVRKNIKSASGAVFVAKDGGHVVGYCLTNIKQNIPVFKIKRLGFLSDLYVKKSHRKMGFGKALQEQALRWFRKKGVRHITLLVDAKNTNAVLAYKKWGFEDLYIEMRKKI